MTRFAVTRWQAHRWGRTWVWGVRRGEWWIGARRNFMADATEVNVFGLTLLIGRREVAWTEGKHCDA